MDCTNDETLFQGIANLQENKVMAPIVQGYHPYHAQTLGQPTESVVFSETPVQASHLAVSILAQSEQFSGTPVQVSHLAASILTESEQYSETPVQASHLAASIIQSCDKPSIHLETSNTTNQIEFNPAPSNSHEIFTNQSENNTSNGVGHDSPKLIDDPYENLRNNMAERPPPCNCVLSPEGNCHACTSFLINPKFDPYFCF